MGKIVVVFVRSGSGSGYMARSPAEIIHDTDAQPLRLVKRKSKAAWMPESDANLAVRVLEDLGMSCSIHTEEADD